MKADSASAVDENATVSCVCHYRRRRCQRLRPHFRVARSFTSGGRTESAAEGKEEADLSGVSRCETKEGPPMKLRSGRPRTVKGSPNRGLGHCLCFARRGAGERRALGSIFALYRTREANLLFFYCLILILSDRFQLNYIIFERSYED